MPAITIRNVPEDARNELAARAARRGQSLQEYLLAELTELARKPEMGEVLERIQRRKRESDVPVSSRDLQRFARADLP